MSSDNHSASILTLKNAFGDQVVTSKAVRHQHGNDESFHQSHSPDAVLFANSKEDIVAAVNICREHQTPIIPYGTGTSLEGHIAALHGGLCIDLSKMNQIVTIHAEDSDCVVQPGVRRIQLNQHLRDTGLFFPVDPGADASIGGMVSTRASGTNAVRYGTMRDNVISVEVVLASGEIIKTAKRTKKSAAGYDLTSLIIGSEGTLGIITEITLKLHAIPQAISAAACSFQTIDEAVNTAIATIQSNIPIARIELLDEQSIKAVNDYSQLTLNPAPTLFMEFHGTDSSVKEQSEMVEEIAIEFGGSDFKWTLNTEQQNKLWQARHDVAYACKALRKNGQFMATDVCVPLSHLAQCIELTKVDINHSNITAPILGHIGDGNFHLVIVIDPNDADEVKRAHALHDRLVKRALGMEGTCTGEHGIGFGKINYLETELGAAIGVMKSIKRTIDPNNIMNPGKIFNIN